MGQLNILMDLIPTFMPSLGTEDSEMGRFVTPNPDVEGSCPCCAGLASLARVQNPDRREESHVGAT